MKQQKKQEQVKKNSLDEYLKKFSWLWENNSELITKKIR